MNNQRRTALVTGGSRGIGAAIAQRLAEDGFNIAIAYLRSADAAEQVAAVCRDRDVEAEAFKADAASTADMTALTGRVTERFGGLDVLVNNAGITQGCPLEETTDEDFERFVNTNVRGVFLASREAAKVMKPGGRIIIIGSVFGENAPIANIGLYVMTKFAVAGFARAWARDLGPKGITVNCIQPGPVDTDMNPADGGLAEILTPRTAIGRYGRATEIAAVAAFLASPASSLVTGACLNVDGGFNA